MISEEQLEIERKTFASTAAELNAAVEASIVTVSEQVFVNQILPIIREWVVDNRGDRVHIWALTAGGLERPMRVRVDPQTVFMVPPPYNHLDSLDARDKSENSRVYALTKLSNMKQRDGETRDVMKLDTEITEILWSEQSYQTLASYNILLAKIWARYGYPVEEVLGDLKIDLDCYDEEGRYISTSSQDAGRAVGSDGEDELQF